MIEMFFEWLLGQCDVVMAIAPIVLSALIQGGIGLAQSGMGAIAEGRKRKEMARERAKWQADNEAWYNKAYNEDYTRRADVQSVIKNMRDELKSQQRRQQATRTITGGTQESVLAGQDNANRYIGRVFSNLAAQGARRKDGIEREYRGRKQAIQGLNYDTMGQQAQSANNLLYNGVNTVGSMNWADILKGSKK